MPKRSATTRRAFAGANGPGIAVVAAMVVVASGCSATSVSPVGGAGGVSQYAPVNELDRPGVIRYLNEGASFVVNRRRESAYRQMHEACNGSYRIDKEGSQLEGGVVVATESSAVAAPTRYWYIQYSCVRGDDAAGSEQ